MTFEETWDFLMGDLPPGLADMKTLKSVMRAFYLAGETQGIRALTCEIAAATTTAGASH